MELDKTVILAGSFTFGFRARAGAVTIVIGDDAPYSLTIEEAGEVMVALNETILKAIQLKAAYSWNE